jgi:hypothetical protein
MRERKVKRTLNLVAHAIESGGSVGTATGDEDADRGEVGERLRAVPGDAETAGLGGTAAEGLGGTRSLPRAECSVSARERRSTRGVHERFDYGHVAVAEVRRFFPGKPYVDRGTGGQSTPQMVLRFRGDVIALQPKVVVILAGTNDIAGNTGPMTLEGQKGTWRRWRNWRVCMESAWCCRR